MFAQAGTGGGQRQALDVEAGEPLADRRRDVLRPVDRAAPHRLGAIVHRGDDDRAKQSAAIGVAGNAAEIDRRGDLGLGERQADGAAGRHAAILLREQDRVLVRRGGVDGAAGGERKGKAEA
jgi:hypothetical protein